MTTIRRMLASALRKLADWAEPTPSGGGGPPAPPPKPPQ